MKDGCSDVCRTCSCVESCTKVHVRTCNEQCSNVRLATLWLTTENLDPLSSTSFLKYICSFFSFSERVPGNFQVVHFKFKKKRIVCMNSVTKHSTLWTERSQFEAHSFKSPKIRTLLLLPPIDSLAY